MNLPLGKGEDISVFIPRSFIVKLPLNCSCTWNYFFDCTNPVLNIGAIYILKIHNFFLYVNAQFQYCILNTAIPNMYKYIYRYVREFVYRLRKII